MFDIDENCVSVILQVSKNTFMRTEASVVCHTVHILIYDKIGTSTRLVQREASPKILVNT